MVLFSPLTKQILEPQIWPFWKPKKSGDFIQLASASAYICRLTKIPWSASEKAMFIFCLSPTYLQCPCMGDALIALTHDYIQWHFAMAQKETETP